MIGVVVPLLFAALAAVPLVYLRNRLPEPLATHWGFSGPPDGAMGWTAFLVVCLVFTLGAAVLARRRAHEGSR